MRFFHSRSTDPAYNLALEETLTRRLKKDAFMVWQNAPSVIVGRNQNTQAEVDAILADSMGISIVRRITGGGAVYHDLGNVNFSHIIVGQGLPDDFAALSRPVVGALRAMGLDAISSGRNDITVGEAKVSGGAKCVTDGRVLYHGTLLFDADLTVLSEVLTPRPEKYRSKGVKSVAGRVANIRSFLPDMDTASFITRFEDEIKARFGHAEDAEITPELHSAAVALADSRYRTWEWNFGASPAYEFIKSARFPGGFVTVCLDAGSGVIRGVRITGDFWGDEDISRLEQQLRGCRHKMDEIKMKLDDAGLERYLQGVSAEQLAGLFF